jgi:hypothetical protein
MLLNGARELWSKRRSGGNACKDLAPMFHDTSRPGAKVFAGTLHQFWPWSMQAGLRPIFAGSLNPQGGRIHREREAVCSELATCYPRQAGDLSSKDDLNSIGPSSR